MDKLESEIKQVFEDNKISLTSKQILSDPKVSFVSKKPQFSLKFNIFTVATSTILASATLMCALIPSITYVESVEDRIENPIFAKHLISGLGAAKVLLETSKTAPETNSLTDQSVKKTMLPTVAFLNYIYTNSDKVDFDYEQKNEVKDNEHFTFKETIKDNYLKTHYDIFVNPKDIITDGLIFDLNYKNGSEPIYELDINSKKKDRDCFLDIDLKALFLDKNFVFNIKENFDRSVLFSLNLDNETVVSCQYQSFNDFNQFIIDSKYRNDQFVFQIKKGADLEYFCKYSKESKPEDPTSINYIFTDEGTIDEIN